MIAGHYTYPGSNPELLQQFQDRRFQGCIYQLVCKI